MHARDHFPIPIVIIHLGTEYLLGCPGGTLRVDGMTVLRQMTKGGHANYGLRCSIFS